MKRKRLRELKLSFNLYVGHSLFIILIILSLTHYVVVNSVQIQIQMSEINLFLNTIGLCFYIMILLQYLNGFLIVMNFGDILK